jgi:hypothetical protein
VLLDKRLVGLSRNEQVGSEGVDPERVLERIPDWIVWAPV